MKYTPRQPNIHDLRCRYHGRFAKRWWSTRVCLSGLIDDYLIVFVPITSSTCCVCCAGSSSYCLNIISMNFRLSRWKTWPRMVLYAFMMHSRTALPTPSRCFRPFLYISLSSESAPEIRITWRYETWQIDQRLVDTIHSFWLRHLV